MQQFPGLWMTKSEGLIYRVVPKCACSTIGQVMYAAEAGHFYDGDIHTAKDSALRKWAKSADRPLIADAVTGERGIVFTCVRNPFTRILSAFFDKVAGLQEDNRRYRHNMMGPLRERYGIVIGSPDNGFAFDEITAFRRFLLMVRDAHLHRTPGSDMHWAPLTSTVGSVITGGGRYDKVLFTEDLMPGLAAVMDRARTPFKVDLASVPRFNESGVNGPKMQHKVAEFFDDLSMHLMNEVYGNDFTLFGYDFDDPSRSKPKGEVDLARLHAHFAKTPALKSA